MSVTDSALPPWMAPTDLSDYVRVPTGTLAQWRHRGTGPRYVKVGSHVRYRREDVVAWLDELATRSA